MGSRLREWRAESGLTQRQVCEIIGMPRRTLEDYEAERRSPPGWVEDLILFRLKSEVTTK